MWFNLWNVGFWMKPKNPKKNLSQLSREGNLTTNSIPHNRELFSMQLQPSKTRILHLQYSFWYISSPVMRRIRRGISLLSKKSTQVDDFLFLFLNWLEDGQSFLPHRKQWMVVIGNGNFYPWQKRLLFNILFITITKFSNLIGYQLSWFQHSGSV